MLQCGYQGKVFGLFRAVGLGAEKLCSGCFTGNYPVPVQMEFGLDKKLALEGEEAGEMLMQASQGMLELYNRCNN